MKLLIARIIYHRYQIFCWLLVGWWLSPIMWIILRTGELIEDIDSWASAFIEKYKIEKEASKATDDFSAFMDDTAKSVLRLEDSLRDAGLSGKFTIGFCRSHRGGKSR